jgi:hypothetical protein
MKPGNEKQREIVLAIKAVDSQMKQAQNPSEFKKLERELAGLLEKMLLQIASERIAA